MTSGTVELWLPPQQSWGVSPRTSLGLLIGGAIGVLTAFLQPSVPVLLESGIEGMRQYQPGNFWWGLFIPGYLLMAAGLLEVVRKGPQEIAAT